jgi:hypothetical protein
VIARSKEKQKKTSDLLCAEKGWVDIPISPAHLQGFALRIAGLAPQKSRGSSRGTPPLTYDLLRH